MVMPKFKKTPAKTDALPNASLNHSETPETPKASELSDVEKTPAGSNASVASDDAASEVNASDTAPKETGADTSHQPISALKKLAKSPPTPPPWYYDWAIALARPLYRAFLFSRQEKLLDYEREVDERFGMTKYKSPRPKINGIRAGKVIWCHAVSLGELNTAYPLLKKLLENGHGLFITTTTQTGFARVRQLFDWWLETGQVVHGFVPIDDKMVLARFLRAVQPDLAVFIETELWANTLYALAMDDVPRVMVNARLVNESFVKYRRFKKLSASMMKNLSLVIAQDKQSYQNFIALGLPEDKAVLADSLKWAQDDQVPPKVDMSVTQRPIWTAGSTHEGEEAAVLFAHKRILETHKKALLILVPRHPERFEAVYKLCLSSGLKTARRSQNEPIKDSTEVYLADTMGELLAWYQMADVVFVGGSLVADVGGHNPTEPAALGKPVVMGRHVASCQVLVDELVAVHNLSQVADKEGLAQAVFTWLDDKTASRAAGQAGEKLVNIKKHAAQVQLSYLAQFLETP